MESAGPLRVFAPLARPLFLDEHARKISRGSLPVQIGGPVTGIAAQELPARVTPGAYDRVFFGAMALIMALTVLVGFGQTYYFRLMSGTATTITGGSITPRLHLHGVVFTAWVLLFLLQTALIGIRRVRLHRRLGYASIALAVTMIVVGLRTAIDSAARGAAPPGVDALTF